MRFDVALLNAEGMTCVSLGCKSQESRRRCHALPVATDRVRGRSLRGGLRELCPENLGLASQAYAFRRVATRDGYK